jgi:hypothetical protein
MSKDASYITERNRMRTLFAAKVLQETAFRNNLQNKILLEGPHIRPMNYEPHYYKMQEGIYATTIEEYNEYVASVMPGQNTSPTVPGAPTGVSAIGGNTQAIVSFTAPINDGGATITSYIVTSDPDGIIATGSSSPITITGLTNGISYTFTVIATNSIGDSVASSASSHVTPAIPPANTPLPPVLTAVTFKTTDTMTLTFTQASNGTPAISNYKYSLNGGAFTALSPADAASPVTISGLTPNTSYTIVLKAVNTNGDSDVSNSLTESTYANVNYATFTTVGTSSWTAPAGVTFIQYLIVGGGGGGGAAYSKITVLGNILVTDTPQAGAYWINSVNLTNGRYSGRMYFGTNSGQNSSSFTDPIQLTASQDFTPAGVTYSYNKWYNQEIVYSLPGALVTTTNYFPPYIISSVYCNNISGGGGGGAGGQVKAQTGTTKYDVTPGTTYTVIVGAGGAGGVGGVNTEANGSPGGDSSFDTVTSLGGSGGGYSRNGTQITDSGKFGKGGNGGQSTGYLVGGSGGGQTSGNNYGRYNSGGPGGTGSYVNFDGAGYVTYGPGGTGGVPNTVASGTTVANLGKGGVGTGATLNSYANGIDGGSGIVILKYYT